MTIGISCPAGYYCPAGAVRALPCPVGTYNDQTATSGSTACKACIGGSYCSTEGLTAVTGDCAAGYFCYQNSPSATPLVNLTVLGTNYLSSTYGLCPQGYYCPAKTSIPTACAAGYYLDAEAKSSITDCIVCPPGFYCATPGLPLPTAKCPAGYFCP